MTVRQFLIDSLEKNGPTAVQAKEIVKRFEDDPKTASMAGRWDHSAFDYPTSTLRILWWACKLEAVKWIDENIPDAPYRHQFTEAAD